MRISVNKNRYSFYRLVFCEGHDAFIPLKNEGHYHVKSGFVKGFISKVVAKKNRTSNDKTTLLYAQRTM